MVQIFIGVISMVISWSLKSTLTKNHAFAIHAHHHTCVSSQFNIQLNYTATTHVAMLPVEDDHKQ